MAEQALLLHRFITGALGVVAWLLAGVFWLSLAFWVHGDLAIKFATLALGLVALAIAMLSRRRLTSRIGRNVAAIPMSVVSLLATTMAIDIVTEMV